MVVLKPLVAISIALSLTSCAKISYLTEQGIGQIKLLRDARDNSELLKDDSIPFKTKDKIKKIEKYKAFFYKFWDRKSTDIYSKTTILKRDAVTYLVISSRPNEIKAQKECFPFYGCFPYLGFYKKDSAKEFVKKQQEDGFETYMRKVLAYSTLGNLEDPILSTFFQYDEYELAETIFHELFHTIFFAKNEVDLNENLANYFGRAMVYEYFGNSKVLNEYYQKDEKYSELLQEIVKSSQKLEGILKKDDWKVQKKKFIESEFPALMKTKCSELKIERCWPLKLKKWNSATFAAFMTYEKDQDRIGKFAKSFNGDIRQLFSHIESEYKKYRSSDTDDSFEKYLLGK